MPRSILIVLALLLPGTALAQTKPEGVPVSVDSALSKTSTENTLPTAEDVESEAPPLAASDDAPTCPEGHVCVPIDDMQIIMQVIRDRHCLENTDPSFSFSNVTIIVDQDGRIFYQGDKDSKDLETNFSMKMAWCHYQVEAGGKLKVIAAVNEPPIWGFRFRPKAYVGYAPLMPLFDGNDFSSGVDAGLMLDFFYWKFLNVNAALGFRTVGAGIGLDITSNFGGYVGYGMSWEAMFNPQNQPLHNLVLGFDFAF
jgi:hypothetical protein